MSNLEDDHDSQLEIDPLYVHSLREARFILSIWACCFVYTVTYCYLNGYVRHEPLPSSTGPAVAKLFGPLANFDRDPASLTYPLDLGIPDWVFYGIAVPWVVCILLTLWYALFFYVEDDLSPDGGDGTDTSIAGPE